MVPNSLLISIFTSGLLLGFILAVPFSPKLQEIRDFFRYRIGYWNMLIPIGIIVVTNAAAYSMLNIAGLALLGPFDLIFIGATTADYLWDRKFNSGKHKQYAKQQRLERSELTKGLLSGNQQRTPRLEERKLDD